MSRIEALLGFLRQNPKDTFSRYALAMEYLKQSRIEEAIGELRRLLENEPAYVAAYYQLGKALECAGRFGEAEETFRSGVSAADGAGDLRAREELQQALELLTGAP